MLEEGMALTAQGRRQAALADMESAAGSGIAGALARGREAQARQAEQAARSAFERSASPLRLGAGESTRVVEAVGGLCEAIQGVQVAWRNARGEHPDTTLRDQVLTTVLRHGALAGEQGVQGVERMRFIANGLKDAGVSENACERLKRAAEAVAECLDPSTEWRRGGVGRWRVIRANARAYANATWSVGLERAVRLVPGAERRNEALAILELGNDPEQRHRVVGERAADNAPVLVFGRQYPYDPERRDWDDCRRGTERWIQANPAVVVLEPDHEGHVLEGTGGKLLKQQLGEKHEGALGGLQVLRIAERLMVAGVNADGEVEILALGNDRKAAALEALVEGRSGWEAGSDPFGDGKSRAKRVPPEKARCTGMGEGAVYVVVDPAQIQGPGEERTRALVVGQDGQQALDVTSVAMTAAARLGGVRDVVIMAKALSQGDHYQRSQRYRNNEPVFETSVEGVKLPAMDPPAVHVGLLQSAAAVAAQGRGAEQSVVVRRGWPTDPRQSMARPTAHTPQAHFTIGLEELLDTVERVRETPTRARALTDEGPPGSRPRLQGKEVPEPGKAREDALKIAWLVPEDPWHPGGREGVEGAMAMLLSYSASGIKPPVGGEATKGYKLDLMVDHADRATKKALQQCIMRRYAEGGFGGPYNVDRSKGNAPTARLVKLDRRLEAGDADMVLVGGVHPSDPAHARYRQGLKEALEAGIPCIEFGRGIGVMKGQTALCGAPADRAIELGLTEEALAQVHVHPRTLKWVLDDAAGTEAGRGGRCFGLKRNEEEGVKVAAPRTLGDAAAAERSAAGLLRAMQVVAEREPVYRIMTGDVQWRRTPDEAGHEVDLSDLTLPPGKARQQAREMDPWEQGPAPAMAR